MKKRIALIFVCLAVVVGMAWIFIPRSSAAQNSAPTKTEQHVKKNEKKPKAKPKTPDYKPYKDPTDLRKEGSWTKSSEKKAYPNIRYANNLTLRVSLKGNRVYLFKGKKLIYTMMSTGGVYKKGKSVTPKGTFYIQNGRGDSFFNQALGEGARNWVSWDPSNVYLFHSVPTKADGSINRKEAAKLGKTQGSHGCIRLSLPDSKWLLNELPAGTKVIIKDV